MSGTIERLELLPVFVEVVRQGSFTAAATQLGLPKSTVSRRVARLERELGATLLVRTTRQLRLTEAGADLFEDAAPALDRLDEAARSLRERQRVPRGTLRITAPIDLGHDWLAEVITTFVERFPAVRVEVNLTNRIVDLVGERFDCAIRAGRLRDTTTLVARKMGGSRFGLFASPQYLARRGVPEALADLATHECVLFRASECRSTWKLDGPSGEEPVEVRGLVSADDFSFLRSAVRAGAGIGMLPTVGLDLDELVRVLPAYSVEGGAAYFVYPRARQVPAKTLAFRDHVLEAYRLAPWNTR